MRIGVLTGGGDCPGLNAVIRAIVRKAERTYRDEIIGFADGWLGVIEDRWTRLDIERVRGILPRGGTMLGTSRVQPFGVPNGVERVRQTVADNGIDAIISVGGEGTLAATAELFDQGLPVVGVPKTIDNDIEGTDLTFGFVTAVEVATEAIDRLHTTAESHNRVIVVEVMGRHTGHIATWAGIAGGAALTLVPEEPFDIDAVCRAIVRRHESGRYATIVVVAEGARPVEGTLDIGVEERDQYGHVKLGGIANIVASEIGRRTGYRHQGDDPRLRAAGRHAERVRSRVVFVARRRRGRCGARRCIRHDDVAAGRLGHPCPTRRHQEQGALRRPGASRRGQGVLR